jgi:hypothetical protein
MVIRMSLRPIKKEVDTSSLNYKDDYNLIYNFNSQVENFTKQMSLLITLFN